MLQKIGSSTYLSEVARVDGFSGTALLGVVLVVGPELDPNRFLEPNLDFGLVAESSGAAVEEAWASS